MADGVLGLGQGASSLNQELIDKLKAAEAKARVEPITKNLENLEAEKTKIGEIKTKVDEFLTSIKPFDLYVDGGVNAFETKVANTSGTSASFEAPDVTKLNSGTTSVNITQLAKRDVVQSNEITDYIPGLAESASPIPNVNKGTLEITVDGTTHSFDTNNITYDQLVKNINNKLDITAKIESSGSDYTLSFENTDSGVTPSVTVAGAAGTAMGFTGTSVSLPSDGTTINSSNITDYNEGLIATPVNIGAGILEISIDGQTHSFDTDNMTYDKLIENINYKSKLSASMEQVGDGSYRIVVKSKDTGVANTLSFSGPASQTFGFTTDGSTLNSANHMQTATNLQATVNGVNYNVSSNKITVDGGLSIIASSTGESSISVTQSTAGLETQFKDFVNKYNELVALVDKELVSADTKIEDKSSLRNMMDTIRNTMFGNYGKDGDKSIFNYGFSIDKTGVMSLDSKTFNNALTNDFDSLKELFIGVAENEGLGTKLKKYVDATDSFNGVLSSYETDMDNRKKTLEESKTKAQETLDDKYKQMASQFAAYTVIIDRMERSFSGLKLMIQQSTVNQS